MGRRLRVARTVTVLSLSLCVSLIFFFFFISLSTSSSSYSIPILSPAACFLLCRSLPLMPLYIFYILCRHLFSFASSFLCVIDFERRARIGVRSSYLVVRFYSCSAERTQKHIPNIRDRGAPPLLLLLLPFVRKSCSRFPLLHFSLLLCSIYLFLSLALFALLFIPRYFEKWKV